LPDDPDGPRPLTFTSDAPTDSVPGDVYAVTASPGAPSSPVTFAADASSAQVCVVTDHGDGTADVGFEGAGRCVIHADQAADDTFPAEHAKQDVLVKSPQEITFTSYPARARVDGSYQAVAVGGDSGNAVVFSPAPGSSHGCDVTPQGRVTFVHATTCRVAADQAGNGAYVAAATAYQQISVARAGQKVTFTSAKPARAVVGRAYRPRTTGGASGRRVRITTTGACRVHQGRVHFTRAGRCHVLARQRGNADYRPGKARQTVTVVRR